MPRLSARLGENFPKCGVDGHKARLLAFPDDANRLLLQSEDARRGVAVIPLQTRPAEEQGEHSEAIAAVEAAVAATQGGDHGKSVQLLRAGGRYVLDAARELSLDLLVRLIDPS